MSMLGRRCAAFAPPAAPRRPARSPGAEPTGADGVASAPPGGIRAAGRDGKSGSYDLAQDASELFDIYPPPPSASDFNSVASRDWGDAFFPSPRPTGETKERGGVHRDGDWHRSVQVWIVRRDDARGGGVGVLLQRRSAYKDTHPGLLDASCAGHVNAGEGALESTARELEEELGGRGAIRRMYSLGDIRRGKAFTVTSAVEGETDGYGAFVCREYQDVFVLWWKGGAPMETELFAPLVPEEVAGFEIMDGTEMIRRMQRGDEGLVPRSTEYVAALAKAIGCVV